MDSFQYSFNSLMKYWSLRHGWCISVSIDISELANSTSQYDKENEKKRARRKTWWRYFKEFTTNTSLHGLKYIGEENRSVAERVWWCLMFVLSVTACSFLIRKVWLKWQQSPVIVSFSETATPVWQIPFPAITVCTESKVKQSMFNITEIRRKIISRDNLTDTEQSNYNAVSVVCTDDYYFYNTDFNGINEGQMKFLDEVAPSLRDTMLTCKWGVGRLPCFVYFYRTLTEDGQCFTFNMLSVDEIYRTEELHNKSFYSENFNNTSDGWSLEGGYPRHLPLETYPIRGSIPGVASGFSFFLLANSSEFDYLCRGPVQGFKVILHSPVELPHIHQYIKTPTNKELNIIIKPNMMTTSEELKSYDPDVRQCYYPEERRLKYFKVYTQKNCEWECLTNYTLQMCGCVSYVMPRNSSTPVCDSKSKKWCARRAQNTLPTREINQGLKNIGRREEDEDEKTLRETAEHCHCLSSCTTITYDAETSQSKFDWPGILNVLNTMYNRDNVELFTLSYTSVRVFFKESHFINQKRSELYGHTDFLANCGGLLGLFLGFSILSLIEIVYFFTLRLFYSVRGSVLSNISSAVEEKR